MALLIKASHASLNSENMMMTEYNILPSQLFLSYVRIENKALFQPNSILLSTC